MALKFQILQRPLVELLHETYSVTRWRGVKQGLLLGYFCHKMVIFCRKRQNHCLKSSQKQIRRFKSSEKKSYVYQVQWTISQRNFQLPFIRKLTFFWKSWRSPGLPQQKLKVKRFSLIWNVQSVWSTYFLPSSSVKKVICYAKTAIQRSKTVQHVGVNWVKKETWQLKK